MPVRSRYRYRTSCLLLLAATMLLAVTPTQSQESDSDSAAALGERLFREQLFTNPAADYQGSCLGCHASGGDLADRTPRVFADYTARSLMPDKSTTLRNTPTLLDAWRADRFGIDGELASLEGFIERKLLGAEMGWSAADRERAVAAIHFTLENEGSGGGSGESYAERFSKAYGTSLEELGPEEVIDLAERALAAYLRTLSSSRTSRWDAFAEQNRFTVEPSEGQSADDYAFNIESRIGNQEGRMLIRRPEGFSEEAYEGFKLFFRVFGGEGQSAGNCIACHTTPLFTDHRFHNLGTAQARYERVHGQAGFESYAPPTEPSDDTRAEPSEDDPRRIDLGWWNFAPPEERDSAFGAFKTPTLRNLGGTDPYFSDGSAATLEDVLAAKIELARRARAGEIRNADPDLLEIELSEKDIAPLAAFLRVLDDVGEEDFRYFLIHFEDSSP